jgi:hypothetical protein
MFRDGRQQLRKLRIRGGSFPAMSEHVVLAWHRIVRERDAAALEELLDDEVVFHSPVVHTPQRGRALAGMYLHAALEVFCAPEFRYVREIVGESDAMLEFETQIDGVFVNGVDILSWNQVGKLTAFKVMIRPLKGINAVHAHMAALLQGTR